MSTQSQRPIFSIAQILNLRMIHRYLDLSVVQAPQLEYAINTFKKKKMNVA